MCRVGKWGVENGCALLLANYFQVCLSLLLYIYSLYKSQLGTIQGVKAHQGQGQYFLHWMNLKINITVKIVDS